MMILLIDLFDLFKKSLEGNTNLKFKEKFRDLILPLSSGQI